MSAQLTSDDHNVIIDSIPWIAFQYQLEVWMRSNWQCQALHKLDVNVARQHFTAGGQQKPMFNWSSEVVRAYAQLGTHVFTYKSLAASRLCKYAAPSQLSQTGVMLASVTL